MAWLSWNQILHSFVYTFNIFLLVDILSKPSAENTKIIDLDIHCFMGETDRCVCYGGKGRVLGESLVGTARLRLGMKDDPSHWQESLGMRQRNCVPWTNKHEWLLLPLSRNEQERQTSSFFPASNFECVLIIGDCVIASGREGGKDGVDVETSFFNLSHTWIRKSILHDRLSWQSYYCVYEHFLCM